MDRRMITHRWHPIASPLHDDTVAALLNRALAGTERPSMLDLGCGEGHWLLRALAADPQLCAVGVDIEAGGLERARGDADAAGYGARLELHEVPAAEFPAEPGFDVVACVGAVHAFGDLAGTLRAVRGHLAPGGRLLIGDGFWEREPDAATLAAFGAEAGDYRDLAGTVEQVRAAGWEPVYGHVSTIEEWDTYEWCWTGSLTQWALDHAGEPEAAEKLRAATEHRDQWLSGYRGTLGFVTLVLRASPADRG